MPDDMTGGQLVAIIFGFIFIGTIITVLVISFLKFIKKDNGRIEQLASEGRDIKNNDGMICENLSIEKIDSIQNTLLQRINALKQVEHALPEQVWHQGPIASIQGVESTTKAVIDKLKEEARLIRQYVANIQSLDVSINVSDRLDGVIHTGGSEEHIFIEMSRNFRNGGSDFIPHQVFRTGEQDFKFAYMRL